MFKRTRALAIKPEVKKRVEERDGVGWRWEGGFRVAGSCAPEADSCQGVAEPMQYCKVK